jgi:cytochrome P450
MDRCTKRILLPQNVLYWIPTHRNSKFNKKRSLVRGLLKDNVQERRSDCNETNDILNKIMEAHTNKTAAATTTITATDSNSNSTTLSDEDLIDILLSVLMSGYKTLSTALTYAIYLISRHPEWEKRCLEETQDAITNNQHQNSTNSSSSSSSSISSNNKELDLPICRGVIMEARVGRWKKNLSLKTVLLFPKVTT